MIYQIVDKGIKILNKRDFVPQHILECGQIFSYELKDETWVVFSWDKKAEISEENSGYFIKTNDPLYFVNFFDLNKDYSKIKGELSKYELLKEPIIFGNGIRILKQNLFETLISFIVSANNNIKRIQLILNNIRKNFGTNMGDYFAFPTREQLLTATISDFKNLGAGYRDKYLFDVLRQVDEDTLKDWQALPTKELRKKLISLAGVGPKVADCVLLFGFGRGDVFPVDTWIEKMYNKFYPPLQNREKIRENLTNEFGLLSGYAQQYLFYYMRSGTV